MPPLRRAANSRYESKTFMARLLPGHRLDPKLQHQRFEVADPRYAFFDNFDFAGKELIYYFKDGLGRACRIALLAIVSGLGGGQ